MTHKDQLVNFIIVACDSRRVKTIAITCRCGNRWTERVPGELHDSELTCFFDCSKCSTRYALRDKKLSRREDEPNDTRPFAKIGVDTKQQYDA